MNIFIWMLNLPYTLIGLIVGLISFPKGVRFLSSNKAFVLDVRKFWWVFGYMKNSRAMTIGSTVLLSPNIQENDLEHELVHVLQYNKYPIIFPLLYYYQLFKNGYKNNKYEIEAYNVANNKYVDNI